MAGRQPVGELALGRGIVVAIDGPSGAGKSTVARTLAAQLSTDYLDTGAMYRALTWDVLQKGIDVTDVVAVGEAAAAFSPEITLSAHAPRLCVGGVDVKEAIRSAEVTSAVSEVAANPQVRSTLIADQREIISRAREEGRGIVVEGRDITTVVAPDADVRLLLTASADERERRRRRESGEATAKSMSRRDARDSQVNNFTTPADGVTLIDTTSMPLSEVVGAVEELVRVALESGRV